MQCKYCAKQVYIAHICPYCQEYYCIEHREPITHQCKSQERHYLAFEKPKTQKTKWLAAETNEKLQTPFTNVHKFLFATAFVLVVFEQILRQTSYVINSILYEANIYVAIISVWLTPYVASIAIFIITCFVLFTARRIATKNGNASSQYISLLKKAIPLGVYATIAIIYLESIRGWLLILLI